MFNVGKLPSIQVFHNTWPSIETSHHLNGNMVYLYISSIFFPPRPFLNYKGDKNASLVDNNMRNNAKDQVKNILK